ncbi:MAG: diguanylate cyclase, partial [Synechococcus sp. ELA057]
LRAAKLPLDRVSLALVPEQSGFNGVQYQWQLDEPHEVHSFLRLHDFFQGQDHRTSVLHHICCTGKPERLRLQELQPDQIAFPLLRDLRRDHFSDYIALPLPPGQSHRLVISLASRHREGFRSDQLSQLMRLLPGIRRVHQATEHFGLGRWEALDPLTLIWSRHHFHQEIAKELNRSQLPGDGDLSLLLLDLKDFSDYNQEFGHLCADEALVAVANQLRRNWGDQSRSIARIGSDSFAMLLRVPPNAEALALLARVERTVQDLRLVHPSAREPFLGCHLALLMVPAAAVGDGALEARQLLTQGELLLAEAQRSGSPRVLQTQDQASGAARV